jgi:glycosyltransferase involved in cell wall biosynthesis
MACQKPVIVSLDSGVAEIVEDGRTGLLFPTRQPQVLAEKLDFLIRERNLAKEIGVRGYRYVANTLSWRRYAESMQQVFQAAIEEGQRCE